MRFFIFLSYKGTNYCGWQRQPNGVSVQQRLEEALEIALHQPTEIVGAGRTDAGVHARLMTAHFDADPLPLKLPLLKHKLNCLTPPDIAIDRIVPVQPEAHARYSALSRTYNYLVSEHKRPFDCETVCRMSLRNVNFALMNDAARELLSYKDFQSFSKVKTDVKTFLCTVYEAFWRQEGDLWLFHIRANRFLRGMVRAIAGTLLDVGRGKITVNDFKAIIEAKQRSRAGSAAPPEGLALTNIEYSPQIFL